MMSLVPSAHSDLKYLSRDIRAVENKEHRRCTERDRSACYNSCMLVIVQPVGHLCNRLILFAHLVAFARKYRLMLVNLAFEEFAPLFPATQGDLLCRYPPALPLLPRVKPTAPRRRRLFRLGMRLMRDAEAGRLPPLFLPCRLPDGQAFSLDAAFAGLARRRVVLLGGWLFRDAGSLAEEAPAVRPFFRPQASVEEAAQQAVRSARAGYDLLIGVHRRGGDYSHFEGGRYYYTPAQYAALLARTTALFAPLRPAFLFCSNEPLEAAAFAGFPVTFGLGDQMEDLYALAACDYLIGPPSTYTTWASFYGQVPLCHVMHPDMAFTRDDFHLSQPWGQMFGREAVP